jgi:tripartite-type tricarboxylate transporter receptor subunit TctC
MLRIVYLGAAAALIGASQAAAQQSPAAQQYPTQTITFVVAFAPGGVADTVARTIAQKLGERTGHTVVVENRGGAGGNLGAKMVTAAAPDGYTVLVSTTAVPINHTLYKNRGYATEDLRVVGIVASTPEAVAAHPSNPAKNFAEFVRNARDKNATYGTAGVGTASYIAAEYFFRQIAKINVVHVPFSGGAPAVTAAIGNHIDLLAVSMPAAVQQIRQGQLRGLGVASPQRASAIPDVPTYAEQGYPDFYATSWVGFFVPAKTGDAVVQKLNSEINAILKDPAVEQRLKGTGFDPIIKTDKEAAAEFQREVASWSKMVQTIGVTVD